MDTRCGLALGDVGPLMFQLYRRLVLDAVTVGDVAVLMIPTGEESRSGVECGIETANLGIVLPGVPDNGVASSEHFRSIL
jgi:hypothetical protein